MHCGNTPLLREICEPPGWRPIPVLSRAQNHACDGTFVPRVWGYSARYPRDLRRPKRWDRLTRRSAARRRCAGLVALDPGASRVQRTDSFQLIGAFARAVPGLRVFK